MAQWKKKVPGTNINVGGRDVPATAPKFDPKPILIEHTNAIRKESADGPDVAPSGDHSLVGAGYTWHRLPAQKALDTKRRSPKLLVGPAPNLNATDENVVPNRVNKGNDNHDPKTEDMVTLYAAVACSTDALTKFDADQPRDKDGKWTIEGMEAKANADQATYMKLRDTTNGKKGGYLFFHGTSSDMMASIMKDGLVPGHPGGADEWAVKHSISIHHQSAHVFVTPDIKRAMAYAKLAREVHPGSVAEILEIKVPSGSEREFKQDPSAYGALMLDSKIPPSWIVKHFTFQGDAGYHALTKLVQKESPLMAPNVEAALHKTATEDDGTKTFYMVIPFIPPSVSKDNDGGVNKEDSNSGDEATDSPDNSGRPRWMASPGQGGKDPQYRSQKPGAGGNQDELFSDNINKKSPPVKPVDPDAYYIW